MFNIDKYCGPKLIEVVYKYLEKRSMTRVHSSLLSNINSLFLRRSRGILLHSQISIHYFCTIANSGKTFNWYPIRRLFSQNNSNIEILFLIVNFFLPILNIYIHYQSFMRCLKDYSLMLLDLMEWNTIEMSNIVI